MVPLPWERLGLDDEAKLKIDFKARPSAGAEADRGFLILSSLDERTRDPGMGNIEASVDVFQFPNITPADENERYLRSARLLTANLLQEFGVHMHEYKRRVANTSGGLVTRPSGGSQ